MKTNADDVLHLLHGNACNDLLANGGTVMLDYIIPLLSSFINPEYLEMWCYPLFMLYFIASTPGLIRQFTKWG